MRVPIAAFKVEFICLTREPFLVTAVILEI
jgi:hypothetical protein